MKPTKRKRDAAASSAEAVTAADTPVVSLPASCTLREAADLKGTLLRCVDKAEPVQLDASALQRIDTAAVQVLCAFARERQARKLSFAWTGDVAILAEAAGLLGVATLLGLPEPAQA